MQIHQEIGNEIKKKIQTSVDKLREGGKVPVVFVAFKVVVIMTLGQFVNRLTKTNLLKFSKHPQKANACSASY